MSELVKQVEKPAFLKEFEGPKGTEELSQIMVPSRLKILQPIIQDETLRADFAPGDCLIVPENLMIANEGSPAIAFTPVVFYREWCIWNPLKMQGQLDFIRDRSMDPQSEIAKRASDPNGREEPCPENPKETLRYMAHLNFLCVLHIEEAPPLPVLMTFVSAEYKKGQRFANLIIARNDPIYSGVYEFTIGPRQNESGNWWGFDINNAAEPYVNAEQFELFKGLHEDLARKVKEGDVMADYEDAKPSAGEPEDFKDYGDNKTDL